jgi:hypothetical protein
MTEPEPSGPLRYSTPRIASVRDPSDLKVEHVAVISSVDVWADYWPDTPDYPQSQYVLSRWSEIMAEAANKALAILGEYVPACWSPPSPAPAAIGQLITG